MRCGLVLSAALALSTQSLAGAASDDGQQRQQHPLVLDSAKNKGHKLHGRFLHITDFHPDPFYKAHSSTSADKACHSGHGGAGYYGAETSDCDSPFSLVNATFDWIAANLKDEIDFVIWTGDSARHDNDERVPRSRDQVKELNQYMVSKFDEVFGRERDDNDPYDLYTVPIVPTLGNNDILPHNIFDIGPNDWTRAYLDIWSNIIPESERHEFDQSGWFAMDLIPGYLTAFSINTLYFFNKNAAVDGCSTKGEPGYRQFEWLRVQLQFLRDRGQKAILVGHVPPARTDGKMNWDETCWQKYALWLRQYRDVIVASFYGHMNVDHFILQDFEEIDKSLDDGYGIESSPSGEDSFSIQSAASYMTEMRAKWALLPKKPKGVKSKEQVNDAAAFLADISDDARPEWETGLLTGKKKHDKERKSKKAREYLDSIGGEHAERFALSFVSPSVVPNYFPTMRVIEYNTSGIDYRSPTLNVQRPIMSYDHDEDDEAEEEDDQDLETMMKKKKKHKKKKQRKRRKFKVPDGPSKSSPPGPAYSPQSLSLLGYKQLFANLTYINNDFADADFGNSELDTAVIGGKWSKGKHRGKKPDKDRPDPKTFKYELFYDTLEDEEYGLKDLTMRSYVELASRMAKDLDVVEGSNSVEEELDAMKGKKKKDKKKAKMNAIWRTFVERAFVGTKSEEEIRDDFGD